MAVKVVNISTYFITMSGVLQHSKLVISTFMQNLISQLTAKFIFEEKKVKIKERKKKTEEVGERENWIEIVFYFHNKFIQ